MTVRMPGMLGVWGSPGHRVWGTAVGQAGQDDGGHGVGCLDPPRRVGCAQSRGLEGRRRLLTGAE